MKKIGERDTCSTGNLSLASSGHLPDLQSTVDQSVICNGDDGIMSVDLEHETISLSARSNTFAPIETLLLSSCFDAPLVARQSGGNDASRDLSNKTSLPNVTTDVEELIYAGWSDSGMQDHPQHRGQVSTMPINQDVNTTSKTKSSVDTTHTEDMEWLTDLLSENSRQHEKSTAVPKVSSGVLGELSLNSVQASNSKTRRKIIIIKSSNEAQAAAVHDKQNKERTVYDDIIWGPMGSA